MRISKLVAAGVATLALAVLAIPGANAQSPVSPGSGSDTAMIFQPAQPLVRSQDQITKDFPNSWGFDASFSDYGFAGGLFMGHNFSSDVAAMLSLDFGTAKGPNEFDLVNDVNKVNRIFVIPLMASVQYRLFHYGLSDNLRPYVTAGAGPAFVMTTPDNQDFFAAFGQAVTKAVPGGFVGVGAKFGTDPKSNFGASLRYFIIPYPGSIESSPTEVLTNLSALYLTVSYGFNF